MSAIAGIFFFDGRPIASELSQWLASANASFGPDATGSVEDAGLLMTHNALFLGGHDPTTAHPARGPSGDVLAWDGRLDNRDDLARELACTRRNDEAVVLAASQRWAESAWERLVGDWSCALWCRQSHTLHLASDYMGVRPLFFHLSDAFIAWSTSLAPLILLTDRFESLSREYMATFLTMQPWCDLTPYTGINILRAGTSLSVDRTARATSRTHWQPTATIATGHSPSHYVEPFFHLLETAIASRTRGDGSIWAELSGGVDSSTIVCVAHLLNRAAAAPSRQLHTITYLASHGLPTHDMPLVRNVCERVGAKSHCFASTNVVPPSALDWTGPDGLPPARLAAVEMMAEQGARTLLAGDLGDAVTGVYDDRTATLRYLIGTYQLRDALMFARSWATVAGKSAFWLLYDAICCSTKSAACEPPAGPTRLESVNRYRRLFSLTSDLGSMAVDFETARQRLVPTQADGSKRRMLKAIWEHSFQRRLMSKELHRTVWPTYPFADKRLVDFLLTVPPSALTSPNRARVLMMHSVEHLLPQEVAQQTRGPRRPGVPSSRPSCPFLNDLRTDRLLVVDYGFIERAALADSLAAFDEGRRSVGNLRRVEYLELWLRSRHALKSAARAPSPPTGWRVPTQPLRSHATRVVDSRADN